MKTLISIDDIKSTILNENVDDKFILDAIVTTQSLQLQELIGSELLTTLLNGLELDENGETVFTLNDDYFNLVINYIQPYLKKQVVANLIIPLNYKIRNAGLVNNADSNFQTVGYKEAQSVQQYIQDEASAFANLLSKYLCEFGHLFPEYRKCGLVKANKSTDTIILL